MRGRCGRGAAGKTIVFGLLKRDDKVYTPIIASSLKNLPTPSLPELQGEEFGIGL